MTNRYQLKYGVKVLLLLAVFFSVWSCDYATELSIVNYSGHDIKLTVYADENFADVNDYWEHKGRYIYESPVLKYNESIGFDNLVLNELDETDIPFDSLLVESAGDTMMILKEELYPGYFDTDVIGEISRPYKVCIY